MRRCPFVFVVVLGASSCREAPPPPPTDKADAALVATPTAPTTSSEPSASSDPLPPIDGPAVDALCKKVIALPVRDAGEPFLTFKERLLCSNKLGYFQQHAPPLFAAMQICADWAHDSTDFKWCVDRGKHDLDGGVFVPPPDRP